MNENSSAQYNCRAYYSDGTDRLVQADTSWEVNPTTYAQISAAGLLTTAEVGSDEQVQITVSYEEGSMSDDAVMDVTIKDFVAPPEVTVDNDGPGSSSTGSWEASGGLNYYGTQSVYSKDTGATYIFTANISDYHNVSMWWTWFSSRCSDVPVEIYDGDTLLNTVEVNQQDQGQASTWYDLGSYNFSGTARVVVLSQSSGCSTCADAVRFVAGEAPALIRIEI